MKLYSRTKFVGGAGSFVPSEINAGNAGPVRSIQRFLDLIDLNDPAWPYIATALHEFVRAGIEIDEATIGIAVKLARLKVPTGAARDAIGQPALAAAADSIVYYIRRGKLIKIGKTENPVARFRDLMPDEILAVEPGGYPEETLRKRQFNHLQASGEYFWDAPELREHIRRVRLLHGDPDPSWRTAQRVRGPWELPPVTSAETWTGAEAEGVLGVKEATIRNWKRCGRLPVVGRDEHRRNLFYREHIIHLHATATGHRHRRPKT